MADSTQKVVLVTGASSGIGKACAEHLLSRGYRVFGAQRNASSTDGSDRVAEMISMDVNDDSSVSQAVQTIVNKAGRLDAVINNAGIALMGSIEDTTTEEAKAQMETNFFGVLRVCRAVLPVMRKQGGGYIVNISSLAGILGLPFSGLYSASKFALEGVSESLRLEAKNFGIRVVLVEPGDFRTQMTVRRQIVKATETNEAYRKSFEKFKAAQERDELGAPTPEPVAYLVEHILRSHSPKLRYSVGMIGQRIVVPLKRLLPQSLFEWLLCRFLAI